MALTTAAVIGGVASVGSAYSAHRAGEAQADAQEQALKQSTTQLNPFSVFGLGGMGGSYGPQQSAYSGQMQIPTQQMMYPQSMFGMGGSGRFDMMVPQMTGMNQSILQQMAMRGSTPQNGVSLSAGDLESTRAALSQFAQSSIPGANSGLPQGVLDASQRVAGAAGPFDMGMAGLGNIEGMVGNGFQNAASMYGQLSPQIMQMFGNLQPTNFQQGLQNTAFTGAAQQAQAASQGFGDVFNNTLATMRAQALPEEQRMQAGLQSNQFATGRLGTTGGALQTEAFARGLGQADLSRQLAATDQARLTQQNALGMAQGLSGMGMGLNNQGLAIDQSNMSQVGLGSQLLQNAFSNFGQSAGLASDLNNQRFSRSAYGQQNTMQNMQQLFSNQMGLASMPSQLQGAQLQNVLAALQGQSGINSQALQTYQAGLATEQAAANARIGAGSNMAQIVGSPGFAQTGYGTAQALSQLASSFAPQGGYLSALQGIFGGGGNTANNYDTGSISV